MQASAMQWMKDARGGHALAGTWRAVSVALTSGTRAPHGLRLDRNHAARGAVAGRLAAADQFGLLDQCFGLFDGGNVDQATVESDRAAAFLLRLFHGFQDAPGLGDFLL